VRDRGMLREAHLKVPFLAELGRALQRVFPEFADAQHPKTVEAMVRLLDQVRPFGAMRR